MPNPVLNDKAFEKAADPRSAALAAEGATVWNPPITDGPASPYKPYTPTATMTMGGAVSATGVLLALLLVSGAIGWSLVEVQAGEVTRFPGWLLLPVLAGVGLVIWASFKPPMARIAAPLYALAQGLFVGAISHVYEAEWNGIVLQAVGATVGVLAVTLVLYALRLVRVTQRFRMMVIAGTLGLAIFYGISILLSLFGMEVPFINSTSGWGIAFSVLAAGLAAFNLFLDFDIIERGVDARAPKYMEWFGALGLMVTLVWLYLEMLRLFGKLRSN
jgi:uncharacterized YccA/Bax inhibitor family protein